MNIIENFFTHMFTNMDDIIKYTSEHIYLTFITVIIALLIGVPLGISVYYYRRTSKLVLGIANVVQAIPSVALLGFAVPLLGIGKLPSIVIVTLYSLLPIIKNTYLGISGIRPETIEAAKGMGLTKLQILYKIQVPIALPVIMGGIRIASVTAVGTVTIAALIGGGGLGYLIFAGVRSADTFQILSGAIPACILALLVDLIFSNIELALSKRKSKKVKSKNKLYVMAAAAVILVGGIAISEFNKPKYDIVVASKDYTEQIILGNLVADTIEGNSKLKVKKEFNLGGSSVIFNAMKSGHVDMYMDYTGTLYVDILKNERNSDTQKVYNTVKNTLKDKYDFYTGNSIGFNNTYTLSVTNETAKKYNLKTISDLADVSDKLSLSATIEFNNREDGLKGLVKKDGYGIKFKSTTAVDGSPRFTAVSSKKTDVIDAFSTEGLLKKFNLVSLEDDKKFFPPYNPVPVVRQVTYDKYPELKDILKKLESVINEKEMQNMNYLVDEKGQKPGKVSKDFLKSKKIIK